MFGDSEADVDVWAQEIPLPLTHIIDCPHENVRVYRLLCLTVTGPRLLPSDLHISRRRLHYLRTPYRCLHGKDCARVREQAPESVCRAPKSLVGCREAVPQVGETADTAVKQKFVSDVLP